MRIRRATEGDRPALAAFAARLQCDPGRHIAYLGTEADAIAAEMVDEDDDWTAVSAVAEVDGEIVGWMMGSVDEDMGRVWWFGPFVAAADEAWAERADPLYRAARSLLPAGVDQEEFGPDGRFVALVEWARDRVGAQREVGSAVLVLDGALQGEPPDPDDGPSDPDADPNVDTDADPDANQAPRPGAVVIRPVERRDVATVATMHDALFPGTHTTGEDIVTGADERHLRLVAELDGEVVGYVAAERQPDGAGYIDYLGVAPARRRQGIGAVLVRAAVDALREIGCEQCSLTVRETNDAARALYRRLGFVEERVIVPLRLGFTLP